MFEFDRALASNEFFILLTEPDFEWAYASTAVHCPETIVEVLDVSVTAYDFV